MAGADDAVVHFADGGQLGGGAREEGFVGDIELVAGELLFFHGVAQVTGHLHDGITGDAAQDGGPGRGFDDAVAHDEDVLAGGFGNETVGIQHHGFVIPVFLGFDLGQDGVHVVAGGLGLAHQGVDVHAGEGTGLDADAHFQGFGAEIGAPGPGGDDGAHLVVAGVDAHFAVTHEGQGTDVAFLQLVGLQGVQDGLADLVDGVGNVQTQDLRGIEQALAVLLQAEDGGGAVGTGIGADAFKNGAAVMQGMGENVNLGIGPGDHFAVKPDEIGRLHDTFLKNYSAIWSGRIFRTGRGLSEEQKFTGKRRVWQASAGRKMRFPQRERAGGRTARRRGGPAPVTGNREAPHAPPGGTAGEARPRRLRCSGDMQDAAKMVRGRAVPVCRGHAAAGKGRTPSVVRRPGESRRAAAGLACQCRAESLQPSRQTFQAAMPVEAA